MVKKIINWWYRIRTKNLTQIPLFVVNFNYRIYNDPFYHGKYNCIMHMNPDFAEHEELRTKIKDCIDYIRDNYDMEIFKEALHESSVEKNSMGNATD